MYLFNYKEYCMKLKKIIAIIAFPLDNTDNPDISRLNENKQNRIYAYLFHTCCIQDRNS